MDKLNSKQGQILRDEGIKQAEDSANNSVENWSDLAYNFLLSYIKTNDEFMTEDVRVASENIIPLPPSARAWGAIVVKAKRENLIKSIGFSSVKNPKAHKTPATLWQVVK